ncbi:helix-turn-helix domain-containing protein [uncultured Nitrosomonas sp.]|uniref:helix-turn-helix domain-containing protein n=1 Tax=uncultured Nitrosomonas sp. TaxID=156424 RepID=UPI0025D2785C|nr:helix-turn-helix domain-containing protein [uncultured Nitrosomonas sp.]
MTDTNDEKNKNVNQYAENIDFTTPDLNITTENQSSEHDNLKSHETTHENVQRIETEDAESVIGEQRNKLDSIASNLNVHHREYVDGSDYQNSVVYNLEHVKTQNELNDIDSMGIVQSVGHLLRRARVARNMSIEDVSRQLRLSIHQIEAIENEDFEKLPGKTFLRGFIRNYANLVQLDSMQLLQLLPESTRIISTYERTPFKDKQLSFSSSRESSGNNPLVIAIVLVVIILGTYFIFENSGWNKDSDTSSTTSTARSESGTTSMEIQLPMSTAADNVANLPAMTSETNNPRGVTVEQDARTELIPAEKNLITQSTDLQNAKPNDSGNLYFKFTSDSWVKVVDAKGASLFEQLMKSGSEQIVVGKRPLSIVIGNASGVNLTYNKKEVNISSYKKQDGTARFTLE